MSIILKSDRYKNIKELLFSLFVWDVVLLLCLYFQVLNCELSSLKYYRQYMLSESFKTLKNSLLFLWVRLKKQYLEKDDGWRSLMMGTCSFIILFFLTWVYLTICISSVQFSHSVVSDSATLWTAARQTSLSITNSWSLLKLMSTESVMPSNHLILCCPLLLLPSIFPNIRVFSNESVLHIRWPKYWSFSFSISPSSEHPGLISFRMDWLDLLAVQGTLKSLLQHHSSKASILRHSAFFMVQLSHPYMTTGKAIALTRQTFVGKIMSLLFNMHSYIYFKNGNYSNWTKYVTYIQ